MIVSNFELLIKRIATAPNNVSINESSVFRRVVQGYFLMVSNLESNGITLYLKLTIPTSSGNRALNNANALVIFDNGNINNSILTLSPLSSNSNPNFTEYRTESFKLNPKQTGLITVLPNVFPFINNPNPDLEIRGFVEIKQRRSFLCSTPEADILITPETRGTFLDNDYPANSTDNELDFDQISYGLPTASGKTQNIVESAPPIIMRPAAEVGTLIKRNDIIGLRQTIKEDNPDLNDDELDIFTTGLINMKGNKEMKKLMDEINK